MSQRLVTAGVHAAGVEDSFGIEGMLQTPVQRHQAGRERMKDLVMRRIAAAKQRRMPARGARGGRAPPRHRALCAASAGRRPSRSTARRRGRAAALRAAPTAATAHRGARKNASAWSRTAFQYAAAASTTSPPSAARGGAYRAFGAAQAQTQAFAVVAQADSGNGLPAVRFIVTIACAASHTCSTVISHGGARQHLQRDVEQHAQRAAGPAHQARHVVARHVLHHLPAEAEQFARPFTQRTPSTKSRAAPA